MTISAWRIVKPKYAATAITGDGARLFGGRWNSKGTAVVYTAGSRSLAVLEMLVHLSSHELLQAYHLYEVSFDNSLVRDLQVAVLPGDWRSDPAPFELRRVGDDWVASNSSAVLRVPSAIVEREFNYLLNPAHSDFGEIDVGLPTPFRFDPRFAK